MSGWSIASRFIEVRGRHIFVTVRHPPVPGNGAVLIVPPFADEMNKCRSMLTQVACELARRRWATVLPDLYGTGDSEGDFRDARWDLWMDDLESAASWSGELGWPVRALLCVRTGCMLGIRAAPRLRVPVERSVFWQPVTDGERFLTQFLRLRVAASMMAGRKETVATLRADLHRGITLEVSGYEISPSLAEEFDAQRLVVDGSVGELHWIEIVRTGEGGVAPSSRLVVDAARTAGVVVTTHEIMGEPFWAATEIVRVPALVQRTIEALAPASS